MKKKHVVRIETIESRRLLAYSYIDPSYGTIGGNGPFLSAGNVSQVVSLPDHSTLFAGTSSSGFTLGRILSDGRTIDVTFNGTGYVTVPTTSTPSVNELDALSNGDIRVLVNFGGVARVYAITANGVVDTSFGNAGNITINEPGRFLFANGWAMTSSGGYFVAGVVGDGSTFTNADSFMAKVTANGQIDTTFGDGVQVVNRGEDPSFGLYDTFSDVVILPDGRPVGFGVYHYTNTRARLGRFNLDGSFDAAWPTAANRGSVNAVTSSGKMQLDSLGRIYVSVDLTTSAGSTLARFRTTDGGPDTTYGGTGFSVSVRPISTLESSSLNFALRPDGSAFTLSNYRVSGQTSYSIITALNANGGTDISFGAGGYYKVTPSEFGTGLGAITDIDFEDANHLIVSGRSDTAGSFLDRYIVIDAANVFTTASGTVFIDNNGNGIKDGSDIYTLAMAFEDENDNGIKDEFERYAFTSTTTGAYSITHLAPGNHQVRLEGVSQFVYTVGSSNGYLFNTGSAGAVVNGLDFALKPVNGVDGLIWEDLNLDGSRVEGENGFAGAKVFLDQNNNGTFDEGEPFGVTNAGGRFQILEVTPGATRVGLELPPGYESSWPDLTFWQLTIPTNSVVGIGYSVYRPATLAPKVLKGFADLHSNAGTFVDVAFSENVAASLSVSDFQVRNRTSNVYLPDSIKRLELLPWGGKTYARLWFDPIIPDGRYELTLNPASIVDVDNNPLMTFTPLQFDYLEGDLTSDGVVNFNDLLALSQRYGTTGKNHLQGNLNRDPEGRVDFEDLLILVQVYRHALLTSPTATGDAKQTSVRSDVLDLA